MLAALFDWAGHLVLAGALGAILGVEREAKGRWAGIRTLALVSVGAALVSRLGVELSADVDGSDPSRIASQVVSGVGFIGAGVIMKKGGDVVGLTTAAMLWVSAAIGIAVGLGVWEAGVVAAVAALFVVLVLGWVKPLVASADTIVFEVEFEQGHGTIGPLLRSLEEADVDVRRVQVDDDGEGAVRRTTIDVEAADRGVVDALLAGFRDWPEVLDIRVRE